MRLRIEVVVSDPFAENTFILWRDGEPGAVVVDPGFDPDAVLAVLRRHGLTPAAVLNTHGHVDHIAGNSAMKDAFPEVPLMIGRGDAAMLTDADLNLSGPFGVPVTSPPADRLLDDGETLGLLGTGWLVRDLPGHSPGHVVFIVGDHEPCLVVGGDVLFRGSVGRVDFPGGSMSQLAEGIRSVLWPLPDEARVLPGHGPETAVGHEKRTNPFVGEG